MASEVDSIDIFTPQQDLLDKGVIAYEENVPLIGQIGVGLTPPGLGVDLAETSKYGRDAYRDFSQGRLGPGFANTGIAALSAIGLVPVIGDLLKTGGKSFIKRNFMSDSALAKADKDDLRKIIDDPKINPEQTAQQIRNHPAIVRAEKEMAELTPTVDLPNFGSKNYVQNRQFNFPGKTVKGYEAGIEELYKGGRKLAYEEMNLPIPINVMSKAAKDKTKVAVINIGPPAAGKSAIANPLAVKYNATIIDPDEAKKVLPEFIGGIGGNAVHRESKILSEGIKDIAIQRGDNLVLPKVGGDVNKIRKEIKTLQNKGYKVNLVLTDIDPDLAFVRMNERFLRKGRLINLDAADAYRGKPEITYNKLKKEGIADGYGKIDTTTGIGEPKQVYEDTAGIFQDTAIRLREGRNYGGAIRKKADFPEYRIESGPKDRLIEVLID
jgi:shikimate kinase